ncbi:uncharacterized protein LOC110114178 [Dendrobium catenatum]|uniref:uncharacterized protein LOC110114178 n=1 Tax=Dendrobium catenatum TaxID=906689 RepID=UPI0009F73719|nr:uncharacterized protein LOC110114178 [Dendrobium catenatum]
MLNEKAGGTPLSYARLSELNSMIFNAGLHDLSSVGHFFTWHNQQQQNPIHIKLDRVIVNDNWLTYFPHTFYKVDDPDCSDHSPLILMNPLSINKGHRFMFKNYCLNQPEFWSNLVDVFSLPNKISPLSSFSYKLKTLKNIVKSKSWSNANTIQTQIDTLKTQQHSVIAQLQNTPLDPFLNCCLTDINTKLAFYHNSLTSWMTQRAKVNWLTNGEDDLKFLYLPDQIKATAIAVIPKQSHATNVKDFRPIALCNVIYKIIAKIIANRMKEVMPLIINPSQGGFIHKRVISDNILLASDTLGSFNTKAKQKYFCAKFDITKAFDMVSRDFLYQRLEVKGFPEMFINWIKACTKDVHFSVSINGKLEGYFNSTSGLRQGCPLSPYLFSISMDGLSSCFDHAIATKSFNGIKAGNCIVSHLMFADDLLVFGLATVDNAQALNNILRNFGAATSLHTNPAKSSILISKDTTIASSICAILNIRQTSSPMIYLGLPIFYKKLKIAHFQPLLQKIVTLLDGWKAKTLSFAGRIQYIKFTICNTLAYWIRGSIIPKSCCKLINRMCARFTFFGNINLKKLHTLSWKNTTLPKQNGGLGIPSIDSMYHSFGCSIIWRFLNSSNLFFCWWRAKYHSLWNTSAVNCSHYWNALCKQANHIKHCINFTICPTNTLSVFWDPWCGGHSIADYLILNNSIEQYTQFFDWKVSDIIWGSYWAIPSFLDSHLAMSINSVVIEDNMDNHFWLGKQNPKFADFRNQFYRGLKTADVLAMRGITDHFNCCFCHGEKETVSHLFFECNFTFNIIKSLLPWMDSQLLKPNLYQVYDSIYEQNINKQLKHYFLLSGSATIYHLWRARNDRLYGGIIDSQETISVKIRKALILKTHGSKRS